MQISIWDLDWYYNRNIMPNIQCMQLSSYCKQKGHNVNFITKEEHINLKCDKIYLFKDEEDIRVDMHLRKNKSKGIAIDGQKIKKAADLLGLLNVVFFSPEDLSMIKKEIF